jgi:hypothetical protein
MKFRKKGFSILGIISLSFLVVSLGTQPAAATTVLETTNVWIPMGFMVSPIQGSGSMEISTTTTVSASGGPLSGTITSTDTWTSEGVNDGGIKVKLRQFSIQKVWDCYWWLFGQCLNSQTSYRANPQVTYTTQTLIPSGSTSPSAHFSVPSTYQTSTTWAISYSNQEFVNDLRSQSSSYSETYVKSGSQTVSLSSGITLYGVSFSFSLSFSSTSTNSYSMDGSFRHYGDFKSGTIIVWSYCSYCDGGNW